MRLTRQKLAGGSRQAGAALLVFTSLLVLISASVLLDRLSNRVQVNTSRDQLSAIALAEAKAALISWSVGHSQEPGRLPWPDRNGEATPNYDGSADCSSVGANNTLLLGRFPFAGDAVPCSVEAMGIQPVDGAKEPLFYAVSQNLIEHRGQPGADPPINPGLLDGGASYPWLTVRDQNGNVISNRVAAVIIAPGVALNGQSRCVLASDGTCANGNPVPDTSQYLDNVTVGGTNYDNSDNDLDFIQYPDSRMTTSATDSFNDRLVFITIDELMAKVEKRVIGEVAVNLQNYRTQNGRYPWLSPYRDPTMNTGADTLTGRIESVNVGADRIVDNEGAFPPDPALEDHVIVNVTRGTFWTIQDEHGADDLHLTTNSDFQPGDYYNVRPAFNGMWGQREGHVPFIEELLNESFSFATDFTANWTGGGPTVCNDPIPGILLLVPGECAAVVDASLTAIATGPSAATVRAAPTVGDGVCTWTDIDTVQCTGTATQAAGYSVNLCLDPALLIPPACPAIWGTFPVTRTYTFDFSYTGAGTLTSNGGVKTRDVAGNNPVSTQTITVQDTLFGVWPIGSVVITVPEDQLVVGGIYFDLQNNATDLPGYFFTNLWHHFVYLKISDEHVAINDAFATSTDNCTAGADCLDLQIAGATDRNEVQAVVVSAGGQLTGQNRSPVFPAVAGLNDYFENTNAATANDTAERGPVTAAFNDQVRVIRPNPP